MLPDKGPGAFLYSISISTVFSFSGYWCLISILSIANVVVDILTYLGIDISTESFVIIEYRVSSTLYLETLWGSDE